MRNSNVIEKILNKLYSAFVILFLFILAPFFDIVCIQKVVLSKFTIMVLKALNANIIFDFDDAIFIHKDIRHLLKRSACVIASNKYLEEFASRYNRNVYSLVTPVAINGHYLQRNNNLTTIGWIGSEETSRYLYSLIPVLKSLKERFWNLRLEFMGIEKNGNLASLLDIETIRWSIEEEERYLARIDIGIMPLADNEWTRGKCGYKLLQYMAMGVPCVASPVGINKEIIRGGINGFLADTPDDWMEKLSLLIRDRSLRQRMGQEGLKLADRLYSYRTNTPKLIEILNCAVKI